jgi:hypothetical protein
MNTDAEPERLGGTLREGFPKFLSSPKYILRVLAKGPTHGFSALQYVMEQFINAVKSRTLAEILSRHIKAYLTK